MEYEVHIAVEGLADRVTTLPFAPFPGLVIAVWNEGHDDPSRFKLNLVMWDDGSKFFYCGCVPFDEVMLAETWGC